jgi:hypothetical protein
MRPLGKVKKEKGQGGVRGGSWSEFPDMRRRETPKGKILLTRAGQVFPARLPPCSSRPYPVSPRPPLAPLRTPSSSSPSSSLSIRRLLRSAGLANLWGILFLRWALRDEAEEASRVGSVGLTTR